MSSYRTTPNISLIARDEQDGTGCDRLAHQLNDRVIRHLSAASFELAGLAATLDDPRRVHQLLACVDQLDASIGRVRAIAIDDPEAG